MSAVLFSLVLNESQLPLATVFPNLMHVHSVCGELRVQNLAIVDPCWTSLLGAVSPPCCFHPWWPRMK